MKRLLVLGLDSVPPELMYGGLLDKLPTFKRLFTGGSHGTLLTCDPPITVPAWMVLMTGCNPGALGIYGFRHRKGHSYSDGYIVNSSHVREACVWDILGRNGFRSCVIGVPPSYPPKALNGSLISCLITPDATKQFTYPPELKKEVEDLVGEYIFDVTFRTEDRDAIKKELFEMTRKRFKVARHLAAKTDWNLFMLHEIGFDRLHHAFWKYFDPSHPKYVKGNKYETIAEEYYRLVDEELSRLIEAAGPDVPLLVLSDHGSKAMKGAFCINQWLEREGYLTLEERPASVVDLDKAKVDWDRTKAWGWGGYYARIFFNVKGREPRGIVEPNSLPAMKRELRERLMTIEDPTGKTMKNLIFEPEERYGTVRGDAPDLMVYLDDLDWRSAGTVGHPSIYLDENDTGPDDSVHSMHGVIMFSSKQENGKGGPRDLGEVNAEDIAPTILGMFGIPAPPAMKGKDLQLR